MILWEDLNPPSDWVNATRNLFGPQLGPILGHLGPSWALLAHLGAILGPSWAILGSLRRSWGHLGPSWGHLGPSWGSIPLFLYNLNRISQALLVFQPLPSILGYVVAFLGLLPSLGLVLASFAWAASVMYPHASSPFIRSLAMWSLPSAFLTRPGGMREAIESGHPMVGRDKMCERLSTLL